jgi:hypothetical protein
MLEPSRLFPYYATAGRANVTAQSKHEPKPLWANAIHNIVETTWRDSVEAALKLERDISGLGGCAGAYPGHDKLRKIFERFSFVAFHFPLPSAIYS